MNFLHGLGALTSQVISRVESTVDVLLPEDEEEEEEEHEEEEQEEVEEGPEKGEREEAEKVKQHAEGLEASSEGASGAAGGPAQGSAAGDGEEAPEQSNGGPIRGLGSLFGFDVSRVRCRPLSL